jgi:hypothetical protein
MASQRAKKRRSWLSQFEHSGRSDGHERNERQKALTNVNRPSLNCRMRSLQSAIETFATRAQSASSAWQSLLPRTTHSPPPSRFKRSVEWPKSLPKKCTKIQRWSKATPQHTHRGAGRGWWCAVLRGVPMPTMPWQGNQLSLELKVNYCILLLVCLFVGPP